MSDGTSAVMDVDNTCAHRDALKGWRVRQLYDMGANPLLLLVYSMATGKNMRAYVNAMNQKR